MREIKFIWVCRNIHFNEIHRVELTDIMLLHDQYPTWIKSDNCEVIAKILPTGLKDKNGKEIYEGDIVGEKGSVYAVEFEDGMFRLAHSTPLIDWMYARKRQRIETEVIGNIYENPELLVSKGDLD